jgi:xylulokinase
LEGIYAMNDVRLLGIDAGTTSLKAVLYDASGMPITSGSIEYNLITPRPNIVEAPPSIYWDSLKHVMKEITSSLNVEKIAIDAIAVSSQSETFVTLDSGGNPLRNVIVWLDSRSGDETAIIRKEFGREKIYHTTGSPDVDPTWEATKLLWIKRNEPELFKKISKVLQVEDYLIYKMTNGFAANGSLYCSSLLYDIINNTWWKDMLDFLGISENILPDLYQSGVKVGRLTKKAMEELGIDNSSVVVSGGMDQPCGCIGTGNILPGDLTENIGASLNVCVTTDKPVFDSKFRVPCQVHTVPGKYMYVPWTKGGGMVLKWFKDNFCEPQILEADNLHTSVYKILDMRIKEVLPGSGGVIMLPHLTGAMSPEINEHARGVFYGLNLSTTRDVILRSIIESITYLLRSNIELIEDAEINVKEIIASGGASNSDIWNQIKSDVLGKPIRTVKNKDSGCLGAAILAGVGCGAFGSIEKACNSLIKKGKEYFPNNDNVKIYDKYYKIYKELYVKLEPLFIESAKLIKS